MPTPTPPPAAFDAAAIEKIQKYAGLAPKPAPRAPAPTYTPAPLVAPPGARLFSAVFGWSPTHAPDVPLPVFSATDWPEEVRPYIPDALPNSGLWHWPREATELLAFALHCGDRTLLHGPTGSGKSALVEAYAHMLQIPLIRVNCHRDMQSTDFLGKDIITIDAKTGLNVLKYEYSLLTIGARSGGLILIDEAFRSPVLMSIQSLLEYGGTLTLPDAASLTAAQRRIVPPKGKSWLVLTDNTNGTGDDSGSYNAEVQDLSTLGRITATIQVPYTSPEAQAALLVRNSPTVPHGIVADLAAWADLMRRAFDQRAVMQPVCMRALLSILRHYTVSGDLRRAVWLSYASKLGTSCQTVASEAFKQVTGNALI